MKHCRLVAILLTAYSLEPDLIVTHAPVSLDSIASKCVSSSCWIGIAHGSTIFLDSPLLVPSNAHLRLSPWPLLGRASLVAVNGSQLSIINGTLSLEALDLFGSAVRTTDGGCIAAGRGASLNVTNSSFNNCTTLGSGGVLSVGERAHVRLRDIRAVDGVALEEGGLIYAAHNASVIIDGASFLSLASATSGGLISIGPFATLDICDNAVLSNGTAERTGGLIKAGLGARVTLQNDALLEYGAALQDGGCVYADSQGIIEMQDNTTLRFCSANLDGGGIKSGGNVSLSGNAVVSDCTALVGGGMVVAGGRAVVEVREAAAVVRCAALAGGGVTTLSEARIVLRDYARIAACTATEAGGGVYGESTLITLAGDAVISNCSVLLPNAGQGGCIFGDHETFVELRDRAQVVECRAQQLGGCIFAADILVAEGALVGRCMALNSLEEGMGGCLVAFSRIVMRDFATLTQCYADFSSAFALVQTGIILLSDNALVSDCTAVWYGAVMMGDFNTTVVLQDDATITRAYSGVYGTFFLQGDSSLLMTGRASIHDCVAALGSGVFALQASLAIHGQNKIVNCSGTAYFELCPHELHKTVTKITTISLATGATLIANGMLIKNCYGIFPYLGGGIYASMSNVALSNVIVEACSSEQIGGAVYATNAGVTMENVRIIGCSAPVAGGGIFVDWSTVSIFNSVLHNNYADQDGGCIFAQNGSRLDATDTTFELCSSGSTGGGIGASERTNITLIDSHMRDCWSSRAGGALVLSETITLQLRGSTTVSNCYALQWGGGISGGRNVFIKFSDTASMFNTSAGSIGGGCYISDSSVLVMQDVTRITATRAASGGGCGVHSTSILMLLDQASIVSANADDNGGGVLATEGSIVQLLDAAFIANSSAGGNGGAVAAQASTVYVRGRVVISRNRASLDGGGIALEGASQLFTSSSRCRWFDFNLGFSPASALISTGEARLNKVDAIGQSMLIQLSGQETVANRQFCLSTNDAYNLEAYSLDASGWSGATATLSSDPELADAPTGSQVLGVEIVLTLEPGNHAAVQKFVVPKGNPDYEGAPLWDSNEARRGGALAQLQLSTVFIEGTSFKSNTARSESSKDGGGGACFLQPLTVLNAYNTSFQNNSASSTGGAVDAWPNSALLMSRVSATGNKASGSGGFARLDGTLAGTLFQQCAFSHNEARGLSAEGGAMLIVDVQSDVVVPLRNVTFESNCVDGTNSAGGGLAIRGASAKLEDVRFLGNEARLGDGGALALLDTSESTVSIISGEDCANVTIEIDFRFTSATCLPLEGSKKSATCDSTLIECAHYQNYAGSLDTKGTDAADSDDTSIGEINRTANACAGCACWINEERYVELRDATSQIDKLTPSAAAVVEYHYCLTPGIYALQAYDELGDSWWNGTYRLVVNGGREYDGPAVIGYKSPQLAFIIDYDDAAIPPSTMENNTASSGAGGAVFVDDGAIDQTPQGLTSGVTGLETNAAYYGSVVASPARRLQVASAGTVQAESGYQIAAGSFVVELIDAFDQRCTSIGDEAAALGRVSSRATFTNSLAVFAQGVATFDRAILTLHPGSTLVVNITSSLSTLLVSQVTFLVVFSLCSEGTIETAVSATTSRCVPCDAGQYWWEDMCHKCREGMDCSEPGLTLTQVPVYKRRYRTTPTSKHAYKCPSKGSGCPGGRATGRASCAEGYTGLLCAACERGYFLKPPGGDGRIRCGHCDVSEKRTARAVLAIGGILLFFSISLLLLTSPGQDLVKWILAEPAPGELGEASAQPRSADLGDASAQPHPVDLGDASAQSHPVDLGDASAQLHTVDLGDANAQPHTVDLGEASAQPRHDGHLGDASAQPHPRDLGHASAQPHPRDLGQANAQPHPGDLGAANAQPHHGQVGVANAQPDPGQPQQNSTLDLKLGNWDKHHLGSGLIKLKEIVAIYQMLAAMRDMFGNNFEVPSVYAAFSMFMSLFGLDMDRILPIRCLVQSVSNRRYYIYRLIIIETLPFAGAIMLFTIALFGRKIEGRFGWHISKPSYSTTVQLALFFVHIIAPTCTIAAISSLVCDKYDYGEEDSKRFLRVATDIDCDSPIYQNVIHPLGVLSVLIFPTAVIFTYSGLLYCFRTVLNNTDTHWGKFTQWHSWPPFSECPSTTDYRLKLPPEVVKKSLYYQRSAAIAREPDNAEGREMWFQFLWSGYRPDCYMFELVDLSKRLFFTALLSLFWPGSRLQITLALVVAICFIDFYTRYRPFLNGGDELLAAANNWVLVVSQLVGLMINTGIGFSKESVAAKALLVGAACVPIVVLVYVLRWWFYQTMLVPSEKFVRPKLKHCVNIFRGSPLYKFFSTRARLATQCWKNAMYSPVNNRDVEYEMTWPHHEAVPHETHVYPRG